MIFRQTAFHAGEIAPAFYGRSELDLYKAALRKCFNAHVSHTGQPNKRPGFEAVRVANDQTGSRTVRAIPFMYLNSVAYVLEFSPLKIRVLFEGTVMDEVVTTYTAEEIWYLKVAQVGNVLTICHRSHAPAELRYVAADDWTLADVDWVPDVPWLIGTPKFNSIPPPGGSAPGAWQDAPTAYLIGNFVTHNGYIWQARTNNSGSEPQAGSADWWVHTYFSGDEYGESDYAYYQGVLWISLQPQNLGNIPAANSQWWALAADLSHPQREWEWTFTLIWKDRFGGVWESMPWPTPLKSPSGKWPLAVDRPAKLSALDVCTLVPYVAPDIREILGIRWYRGRNGIFGYIGESEFVDTPLGSPAFKDDGLTPDYSRQPPDGTNPFLLGDGTYSYPAGVVFHEGRRVFFGSEKKPQTFWGSSIDSVNRYDQTIPVKASDSYEWTLQADRIEEIRSAASVRNLILLSGQSEWEVKGNNNGDPVSPLAVDAKRQSGWGSNWLDPVFFGYGLLFVQALGTIVRDLTYDFKYGAWAGDDVSHLASHFLDGYTIVDWCFARVPDRVIWMVRSDGKLLSFTYDREEQTKAWALHETDGVVEAVCSVPEDGEDRVYIVVVREGVRLIERSAKITQRVLAARTIGTTEFPERLDQRYAVHLDCAFVQDGTNESAARVQVTTALLANVGATYAVGTTLVMKILDLDGTSPFAALDASMVGDEIVLEPDGAPVRLRINEVTGVDTATVEILSSVPVFYQTEVTTDWGWARREVVHPMSLMMAKTPDSGEGTGARGVSALADGETVQGITTDVDPDSNYWQGSVLHLVKPAVVCVLGLSYNADIELLDIAENAEARARIKDVSRVFFETTDSRGLWLGESFDDLTEWTQREVSDEYGLITPKAEIAETFIRATWNRLGRACLRSIDPLPMTLLAVSREVTFGGS